MNEKYGYKNLYKIAAITQYLGVVTVNVIGIKMPLSLKKNGTKGKEESEQCKERHYQQDKLFPIIIAWSLKAWFLR